MKKLFFCFLVVCSSLVFGSNQVSDKMTVNNKQTENVFSKRSNDISLIHMSSDDYFNLSVKKILDQREGKTSKTNLKRYDYLQSYLQKAEQKATKRLDSCIVKDINGKIFAKDYYYYYPKDTYPAGALKSNELWNLDEEDNKWHGFRMSATYDEFGNGNNRLVELNENGQWIPSTRYTALYTAREGDLTLDMVEMYEDGEWVGDSKRTKTFDSQGRITLMNVYGWDRTLKNWVNGEKADYVYESGKSTELSYAWLDGKWVEISKMETWTDQNGNVIKKDNSYWNNELNNWRVDMRVENEYDSEGNPTLTVNYNYSEEYGELLPFGKEVRKSDNNVNTVENYGYNNETKQWDGISKIQEKYVNDLLVEDYFYSWSIDSKDWINDTKGACEYNNDGKPTLKNSYTWNGSDWQNQTKTEYEYNEYGYESHSVGSIYDLGTNDWIKNSELISETDSEGRILLMEPYMLDEEGNWGGAGPKEVYELDENGLSLRDQFFLWNPETKEWQIDEIDDYFYTLITSEIRETSKDATQISVWGIAGNICIVNAGDQAITIYTAGGMLVNRTNAHGNNKTIPMDKGFYIVRVGEYSFKVNVR